MTMPELYKQKRRQWYAISALLFLLVLESQGRVSFQSKFNEKYTADITHLRQDIKQTTFELPRIMPSCLAPLGKPKHGNHKDSNENNPVH